VDNQTKKFHFQEINWTIEFSNCKNAGKYRDYNVTLKTGKQPTKKAMKLGEVLDEPEFDLHYPHTVGYYKTGSGDDTSFEPEYLELREIRTVEELWVLLNSLNL